jgi:hypothetical protein
MSLTRGIICNYALEEEALSCAVFLDSVALSNAFLDGLAKSAFQSKYNELFMNSNHKPCRYPKALQPIGITKF